MRRAEALKTNSMFRLVVMAQMASAVRRQCSCDSMTFGPAIKKNGRAAANLAYMSPKTLSACSYFILYYGFVVY